MERNRAWILIFFGAGLLAVVLLSSGLDGVELLPSRINDPQVRGELRAFLENLTSSRTFLMMLVCLSPFLLLSIYLLATTRSRTQRRRARRSLWLEIILWMIAFLMLRYTTRQGSPEGTNNQSSQAASEAVSAYPAIEFAGDPSNLAAVWTGFLMILLVGLVLWIAWRRTRPAGRRPLNRIGEEAEIALSELQSGGDFRNAILRCYAEMCQVVDEQKGVRRQETMTAREFELRLHEMGLPSEPVQQLTRLFEQVRYGAAVPEPEEENQAIRCLSAISQAARRPA